MESAENGIKPDINKESEYQKPTPSRTPRVEYGRRYTDNKTQECETKRKHGVSNVQIIS